MTNITEKYSLALDFHENSTSLISPKIFDSRVQYKIYPNARIVSLEKNSYSIAQQSDDLFLQTLLVRKSVRAFSQKNVPFDILARLLTLSFGLRNDENESYFRTYASAGGRYPIEVYIAVLRSDEIEEGVYHYNIFDNGLERIKNSEASKKICEFYDGVQSTHISTDYPLLIIFSMIPERTMQKYGERGYRFVLIDAGHMGQNLYLVAKYLNMGLVAFDAGEESDDKVDEILGLSSVEENVFYSFAVGYPQN